MGDGGSKLNQFDNESQYDGDGGGAGGLA